MLEKQIQQKNTIWNLQDVIQKKFKLFNDSINLRIKENYVKSFIQNGNCKQITNMKKETYLIKIVDVENNRTKKYY